MKTNSYPKWPELRVSGDNIGSELGSEVVLRTDEFFSALSLVHSSGGFRARLAERFKIPKSDDFNRVIRRVNVVQRKIGHIGLEYLCNDQIGSSWIGGNHGWCNWSGEIGTYGYNIGKWPSEDDVLSEWQLIARTFPFLNLRAQIMSGESCEEGTYVLSEFLVSGGVVKIVEPGDVIPADNPIMDEAFYENLGRRMFFGEPGCALSIEQICELYRKVANKIG